MSINFGKTKLHLIVPYSCLSKSINDLLIFSCSRRHFEWLVKRLNVGGEGEKLQRYTTLNCNWNIVSESKEDQLLIEDRMADRLVGWERVSDGWPTGKQGGKG